MTDTEIEILKFAAHIQTEAILNPTRHSDLLKQAADIIVELVIKMRVYEELEKERKPS